MTTEYILPAYASPEICVVFISSEKYAAYTSVAILSLLRHISSCRYYDIVVLHNKMTERTQKKLQALAEDRPNVTLRTCDVGEYLKQVRLDVSGVPHTDRETFFRLLIPDLFFTFDRLVYLDSDLVICADVGELQSVQLPERVCMAGVVDIDVVGQCNSEPLCSNYYYKKILGISSVEQYLQTGVLLLNPKRMHEKYPNFALVRMAAGVRLKYADQDLLNIAFQDDLCLLDMRWNVVNDCGGYRIDKIISHVPEALHSIYCKARMEPWIIHYSGYEKPWNYPGTDMAEYFWKYAKSCDIQPKMQMDENKGKSALKRLAGFFFPRGTTVRDVIKLIYYLAYYRKVRVNTKKLRRGGE